MWFKNLKIFRLFSNFHITSSELETLLSKRALHTNQHLAKNAGFIPFFEEEGTLVHKVENYLMFKLRIEKKLLPSSVINQALKERVKETEEMQGYKVGKKQTKEIKENVTAELLPIAFSVHNDISIGWDLVNKWMFIDTSSNAVSDEVTGNLVQLFEEEIPFLSYMTNESPTSCMTSWLINNFAPENFTIDKNTELKAFSNARIRVRYDNESPEHEEISKHITSGKKCTKLAMTWNDRISFVLNEHGDIKNISPLNIQKESNQNIDCEKFIERFDADMTLMFGEFNELLKDLSEAMGGEKEVAGVK